MGRSKLGRRLLLCLISTVSLLSVYLFGFKDFVESKYSSILIFLQCCYPRFIILRNECLILLCPSLVLYILYIYCTFLHCIYFAPVCRILAYWLMLSVLNTTLNKDYSILFFCWLCLTNLLQLLYSQTTGLDILLIMIMMITIIMIVKMITSIATTKSMI